MFANKSSRLLVVGAIIVSFVVGVPRSFSDDISDLQDAVKNAEADVAKAQKEAADNRPNDATKGAEDKLDDAARKNGDTPGDLKTDKAKQDAQKAEDTARTAADKATAASNDQDAAKAYRKALEKRREARTKIKTALAKLKTILQKRLQHTSDNDDIQNAVKDAAKALKAAEQPIAMLLPGPPTGDTLAMLAAAGKVKIDSNGTGETIGHIADLVIQNLTDQPINCVVPPMILESSSGKNQHYACPKGVSVALNPHDSATVPMDGVCVDRSKPPVGKGVTGDLVVNEGNPTIPQNPDSHIPAKDAGKLLRICTGKYDAADKLQKDGALKDLPYHDKQKQKDIVVQWSTWTDPQISEITGAPPATKEDLKKVVYKQVEQNGPMTPETKKKVDQGIDTIFEKVELTTAKAKDLEKPDTFAAENSGESSATGGVNVSNDTPTPAPPPQTQEKPKKYKFPTPYVTPQTQDVTPQTQEKGPKKWPKPIQDWVDKKKAAADADFKKKIAQDAYTLAAHKFFYEKSKHYREVYYEKEIAKEKKDQPFRTQEERQAYQDKIYKADKELKKLEGELEKDFRETPEGQKKSGERNDAEKAADKAHDAEKEAGKNIDPATKEAVAAEEAERDKKAAETERAERDRKAAEAETEQAERDRKAAGTDDQKKDEKPRP
jgi:hypothetical protein